MLHSFEYIADEKTTTLIIGSMPGVASLMASEYYAHKHNLFWKFVFEAFGEEFSAQDYTTKISFLQSHQFGLWDAAQSCLREGSLDTNIKNVAPNDFKTLFQKYPNIKRLLFNGQKAFQLFKRFHGDLLEYYEYTVLPSTSPANASIPFEERRRVWFEALLR
ncbi:MAG: DNA-deoxyinosine glycosylase [Acetobacter sp.]|nr:DNA-deoxyinosine glycosylase [Acetobacter sp.]